MKKAILIVAFGVAFCFALVSVVQAGPDDPVTERWAKRNLINKQKVTKIPIWQITREGTARAVNWVNAINPRFAVYDAGTPGEDETDDDVVLDKETGLRGAHEVTQLQVDRLAQPYIDAGIVVGMTIGVIHDGQKHVFGYGQLSAADQSTPDGQTVYEIGSITKVFTGVLLGEAAARGAVTLNDPVHHYLPADGFTMPTFKGQHITLKHLATHASGLPKMPANFHPADLCNPFADYTLGHLYVFLSSHELRRAPLTQHEYSNVAMGLLGHALARQAQGGYQQLLVERLCKPLQMADTRVDLSPSMRRRLAPPHQADGAPASNWDIPTLAGAGAIRSTVDDMLRFLQAQLAPPPNTLGRGIETAWQVQWEPTARLKLGLGWHLARDGHTRWHSGQTGGYRTMALVSRKHQTAVVVLANTATKEVDRLARDVFRAMVGVSLEPRTFSTDAETTVQAVPQLATFRDRLSDGTEGPEMVKIPVGMGTFLMGSPDDEKGRVAREGPVHRVTFARPFAMGRYELTVAEFGMFVKATGYRTDAERSGEGCWLYVLDKGKRRDKTTEDASWRNPYIDLTGVHPVVCVSWNDAQAYVKWLSKETGKRYRLPTEAEWEYAARANTKTAYWWGDDFRRNRGNCLLCGSKWDCWKGTAPVGSFPANPFGLSDTAGNVWEWVQDCRHQSYKDAPKDGHAWGEEDGGDCLWRGDRGGSLGNHPTTLRSAFRGWDYRPHHLIGFRLAQDL